MEQPDYVKSYLHDHKLRNNAITHILYVIMCFLLTNKILSYFGLHYLYPKKIDAVLILNFFMTGQIIIPLVVFIAAVSLVHSGKSILLMPYLNYKIKETKDDIDGFLIWINTHKNWFSKKNDKWIKGKEYDEFKEVIADWNDKNFSIFDFANIVNTFLLTGLLNILLYKIQIKTIIICESLFFLLFIANCYNLRILHRIEENKDKLLDIFNKIEKDESDRNFRKVSK